MRYFFFSYYWVGKDGSEGWGESHLVWEGFPNRNEMVHGLHKKSEFAYKKIVVMNIQELSHEDYEEFSRE